ncbi:popeye domain-containing protein 3-like isoform X2 [Xenia sp. Carnegie-2017]|uniref:popeye domain-containing protein 3-like isoform X2 n=1 Tax=Xenia sp. Carnegie-2017 TaxID=2897299 RepID=UPI001F03846C|nr:popeye domain-containing protein 3-like isoform X2 [Xenia sp. Carnegie-2017]
MTYTVDCEWLPANHFFFHCANFCLLLSYACPPTFNGLIYLRISLGFASLFFALWGWIILCSLDTFLWNFIFFIGNFLHLFYVFYCRRTKKFSAEMELVYANIFQPVNTLRHQFQYLTKDFETKVLEADEILASEGVTQLDNLWILLKGKLNVLQHDKVLYTIEDCEFINSPEWIIAKEKSYIYKVTFQAKTDCKIISWNQIQVLKIFKKNSYLKAIVDSVLSQDVAKKLFESSHIVDQSDNGPTQSLYSKNEKDEVKTTIAGINTVTNIVYPSLDNLSDEEETCNDLETKLLSNNFNNKDIDTRL